MQERLNLYIDEAGCQDLSEGLCLVAVVLHEHNVDIEESIRLYEDWLRLAGLDDVPFHGKDLLHGNESYKAVSVGDRKRLLTQFVLARNVADFREANHSARRLLQMADFVCTVERARIAYDNGTQTKTQERFFGNRRNFMQSYMKQLVRKSFT